MNKKSIAETTLVIISLIVVIFTNNGCSLQPLAWTPPVRPDLAGKLAENELLSATEWIHLDGWYGPEDIAFDHQGNLYAGVHVGKTDFSDGRIIKIDTKGNICEFANTGSWVIGLQFDEDENLIDCDPSRGLISVNRNGEITILASEDKNGNQFLLPNDVDIASNGMIYFSNTSSKVPFGRLSALKILLETRPDGGLYSYNPKTKEVKALIEGSFFANGVAVSQNDDFVLLVELAKYRILRHWLKGVKKGQTDVFIDNLPGLPNGISRRKDGGFWLGFTTRRIDLLDKIHPKPFLKKLVYALPLWMQPELEAFGMIMRLSESGEILKTYYDTSGKYVSEASSVEEHKGYIFIGGDITDHVGRYKLERD
jgi:sugar lactone lactonase YvrE